MEATTVLAADRISKSFAGVPVLRDVTLPLVAGRMTGLVGENGAGKSTLIKILTGLLHPDSGEIILDGEAVARWNDHAARLAGVSVIHQEMLLVPELTVAENVMLGETPRLAGVGRAVGVVDKSTVEARARELLASIGITNLDVRTPVRKISPSHAQMVLIARSLRHRSRVLILDEPTAALAPDERTELFALLRRLLARGTAVLFVSHHLHEVEDMCDDALVLRNGMPVARLEGADLAVPSMIQAMLDRSLGEQFPPVEHDAAEDVVLRVRGLRRENVLHGVDLEVRRGEILGVTGLLGAGKTELARALVGVDEGDASIEIDGSPSKLTDPRRSLQSGLQLVPEERKVQALFPLLGVFENGVISALAKGTGRLRRRPVLTRSAEVRRLFNDTVSNLGVRHSSPAQLASRLSGGNQQKLIIARALACKPRILVLDEPTRGVDVGSKREIYRIIIEHAAQGLAVIVISSDTREVLGLAHRILVMRDGVVTAEVRPDEVDNDSLNRLLAVPAAVSQQTEAG